MARPKVTINPVRGQRLKELIEQEGITQEQLSREIYVSQQTISKIINGKASLTEATARVIIDKYPGYDLSWLLGYDFRASTDISHEDRIELDSTFNREFQALTAYLSKYGYTIGLNTNSTDEQEYILSKGKKTMAYMSTDDLKRFREDVHDFIQMKIAKLTGGSTNG